MGGYMDWKRRGTSIDNVWGSPWVGWGELDVGRNTGSVGDVVDAGRMKSK